MPDISSAFPSDTPESIRRDIEIIQRELPLDLLEFNILTPLPGSEDHKILWNKRVDMDADLNKYDLEHVVTDHPKMTREALQSVYQESWGRYYAREHIETLLKRAVVTDVPIMSLAKVLIQFSTMMQLEKVHPLQSGLLRMRHPSERRAGFPQENRVLFHLRHIRDLFLRNALFVRTAWWVLSVKRRIESDPDRHLYMDQALTAVQDNEDETFDYLTKTEGAKAAIDHIKKVAELTRASHTDGLAPHPKAGLGLLADEHVHSAYASGTRRRSTFARSRNLTAPGCR